MVLKDGQIVEQGSHKELVAFDGIFASMWADQVSATDEPVSVDDNSVKREVSGYAVEEAGPQGDEASAPESAAVAFPETSSIVTADNLPEPTPAPSIQPAENKSLIDLSESAPVVFPTPDQETVSTPEILASPTIYSPIPVTPSPLVAEPLAFPTTEELEPVVSAESERPERVVSPIQGPAVTFGANVNLSRTGTPDPDSEPKRKRISSQNFQRLARRISLTTRRQSSSSSIIPGLMGKKESPRVSTDDSSARGEGGSKTESPAGSIKGDADKGKLKKKEKKEKSRKASI